MKTFSIYKVGLKKFVFGIFFLSILVLILSYLFHCTSEETNIEKTILKLKEDLIIYPKAGNVRYFYNLEHQFYMVYYSVRLHFPSIKVLDFYKTELKKIGYIPFNNNHNSLKEYEWRFFQNGIGYDATILEAKLESFWCNKTKKRLIWLYLKYKWDLKGAKTDATLENNKIQNIFLLVKFQKEFRTDKEIDITENFSNLFFEKPTQLNRKEMSIGESCYIPGKEKISFKIIKDEKVDKIDIEEWEEITDLDGQHYWISREAIITEKDINCIRVKKDNISSMLTDSLNKNSLPSNLKTENLYQITIQIKKESWEKIGQKINKMVGKHLGIIKNQRLIVKAVVRAPIKKEIFLNGIDFYQMQFLLKSLIKIQ